MVAVACVGHFERSMIEQKFILVSFMSLSASASRVDPVFANCDAVHEAEA